MSKKPEPKRSPQAADTATTGAPDAERHAEASVLEQAREALHRAEEAYRRSRQSVTDESSRARAVTVGDILDGTLEFARRHPVTGLLAVGTLGFLLGRTTRR